MNTRLPALLWSRHWQ